MYPYPRHVSDDEPTITDVRGVLPGQRPPIDPTVLDEPTSEVPMIRPRFGGTSDAAPVAAEATDQPEAFHQPDPADEADAPAEPEAVTEVAEADPTDVEAQPDAEPEAVDAEPAADADGSVEPGDAQDVVEPEADAVADADAIVTTDTDYAPEATGDDLDADDGEADSALETPDVPAAELEPEEAVELDTPAEPLGHPISEMSKMAWAPVPAAPLAESAPEPVAEAELEAGVELDAEPEPVAKVEPVAEVEPEPVPEPAPAEAAIAEPDAPGPIAAAVQPEEAAAVEAVYTDFVDEPVAEESVVEEPVVEAPVAVAAPEPVVAHRPGEVAQTPISLWSGDAADRMRAQWRELQIQFIDDPDAAVAGAKNLVTNAVDELAGTLLAAQDALDPYRETARVDTETMRVAMRQYREFLDRVLAL